MSNFTFQSVKSNQETEILKLINVRLNRYKQKKSQSHNNLIERRSSRRHCKIENKDLNSCNNDSTTSSFISEDTNLSSTSTYSNNNNISLDTLKKKRSRSLSKTSEESNARSSSGYDTNTSADNKSVCPSPQMFKGFTNAQNENCKIERINEMLDDLKSEINEEKNANEYRSNNNRELQENFVDSCKTGSCNETLVAERSENEKLGDNLSSSSKTDDEKLNEIISAESCKLSEDVYLKNVCDNVSDISTSTSKSDDEKLSETKTSDININKDSLKPEKVTPDKSYRAPSSDSEKVIERKGSREVSASPIETESKDLIPERNLRKRTKLRSRYRATQRNEESKPEAKEDDRTSEADKKDLSASEMRLREDNLDDDTNNFEYHTEGIKDPKTEEHRQHFNKMLSDLGVSEFQLVVDSVGGLRDLITSFVNSKNNNANSVSLTKLSISLRMF